MPKAKAIPAPVNFVHLETFTQMADAVATSPLVGYHGTMGRLLDGTWEAVWVGGTDRVVGHIGDTLVWNGTACVVMPNTKFLQKYDLGVDHAATSKALKVDWFPIDTWENMAKAWNTVSELGFGYYGALESLPDGTRILRLTTPTQPVVKAVAGDNVVWDGTTLAVINDADFVAGYTPL